jgi:hypothetical protein
VIVAVGVGNQPSDFEHMEPMLQHIAATAVAHPDVTTMDVGYLSRENAQVCSDQGNDGVHRHWPAAGQTATTAETGPLPREADAKPA